MDTLSSLSNDLADAVAAAARAVVTVNARRRIPSTGVHWRPGIVVTAEPSTYMVTPSVASAFVSASV